MKGLKHAGCHVPSLMSDTLGAWARLEMGAFWAGVFWGVLVSMALADVGVGRVTIVMAVVCVFSSDGREDRSRRWNGL